jgi:hypothetical protein
VNIFFLTDSQQVVEDDLDDDIDIDEKNAVEFRVSKRKEFVEALQVHDHS